MGDYEDEDTTNNVALSPSADDAELCALISVEGVVTTHVLPAAGAIEIGRGASCDLVIEHPSVSRHHATLQIAPLRITDARSRNGTRLRGEPIAPGIAAPIAIGEAVQLGQATVLIHHRRLVAEEPGVAAQRSSEALVRQLEIECARSARSGSPFAYARVHVQRGDVSYEQMRATLRMTDVVADSGGKFELLLPDTSSDQVAGAISRVNNLLAHRAAEARVAVARYPFDGTTAEALIARVWEQLDAPMPVPVTEMDAVRALIARVAASEVSVLINGETGVGKELCAEMLHRQSRRAGRPFVKLNCSSITESLIESELFGHERGAFTGATATTPGLFEAGDGGTVFLDEIGELALPAQAKLLRVLEERVVRRVGATVGRTLDVRFVCATNRMLSEEIDAGRFRRDLYYRINGVTVSIPPLRERHGEIAGLARAFAARPRGSAAPALSPDVIATLQHHQWPGNIRELRNTIERAVLLAGTGPIKPEHLVLDASGPRRSSVPTIPIERISEITVPGAPGGEGKRLADTIAEVERRRILDALDRCGGNQTRAARLLGISRNTLLARLDSYGLPRPRKS
ncbi:MAG TPA: sigma 54-interacting transcriptional regulator [Kofleriaceae bacterium]